MIKNFEIPLAVIKHFNLTIKDMINSKNKKDVKYEIIAYEKAKVPLQAIKICLGTLSAFYIKIQITNKQGVVVSNFSNKVITIDSIQVPYTHHCSLDEKASKFPTIREHEETLIKKALDVLENEASILHNQSMDESIDRIVKQLDPTIIELINIPRLYKLFKNTPGFMKLLIEIIQSSHAASYKNGGDRNRIKGKVSELKVACSKKEPIKAFTITLRSPSNKVEFDLETVSGTLVECKSSENALNYDRLDQQAKVAKYHGKKFEVCFIEPISDSCKQKLNGKNIPFYDNIKNSGIIGLE